MMKVGLQIAALYGCALVLAIPVAAANPPGAKSSNKPAHSAATKVAAKRMWPAETLTGKITMVDPGNKLVVVKAADGVLFDMMVTPRTRIRSGSQPVTMKDLTQDLNKNASIKFIPERRGDVARSIHITT